MISSGWLRIVLNARNLMLKLDFRLMLIGEMTAELFRASFEYSTISSPESNFGANSAACTWKVDT